LTPQSDCPPSDAEAYNGRLVTPATRDPTRLANQFTTLPTNPRRIGSSRAPEKSYRGDEALLTDIGLEKTPASPRVTFAVEASRCGFEGGKPASVAPSSYGVRESTLGCLKTT
jgi:hypothetical protein